MIRITLSDAYNSWIPLSKLGEKELPIKTAYTLGKLIKAVREEATLVEAMRMKLASKYGDANETGGISLREEDKEKFVEEWNDFMAKVIEINLDPLNDDFINEISFINMTASEMAFLSVFMEGYEPPVQPEKKNDKSSKKDKSSS